MCLSLASGEIPHEWKNANPSSKLAVRNIENCRPISVLPVVVKVLETLVYAQLLTL